MYLHKVKLKNIRCFDSVSLDFARDDGTYAGWTVLAGRNGAGKSTLLQAIAGMACGMSDGLFEPANMLRDGCEKWNGELALGKGPRDNTDALDLKCRLSWQKGFRKDDRGLQGIEYVKRPGCLLLGYGPFRRLSGHTSDALELMSSRFWPGRVLTLFRNDASLAETVSWLREIDYRGLKGDERERYQDLKIQTLGLLSDGLLPDGSTVKDVDAEGLRVQIGERQTTLDRLSDGFRAATSLVVDILRNMFFSYGDLAFEERNHEGQAYPVCAHEGVILIDEVETHLHMSWQREIGFWLKRHFPNVQFLVSTHSPFVCQAADSMGIIRLPDPSSEEKVTHVSRQQFQTIVNGNTDDAATSDLFGLPFAHSDHAERLRERFAALEVSLLHEELSERDRKEKRSELNALKELIPLGLQEI